jgi:hypothetical protein
MQNRGEKANLAREDLIRRMKELSKRPLPTLEQVRKQWESSVRYYENIHNRNY